MSVRLYIVNMGKWTYSPEIGQQIADLIGLDFTYTQIEEKLGIPFDSVQFWMAKEQDLQSRMLPARIHQADAIEGKIGQMLEDVRFGAVGVDVARVYLPAMQWRASKKNPKVYGDKTILSNDPENPITSLALRLDSAITQHKMIDITPEPEQISHMPGDGSDLV